MMSEQLKSRYGWVMHEGQAVPVIVKRICYQVKARNRPSAHGTLSRPFIVGNVYETAEAARAAGTAA